MGIGWKNMGRSKSSTIGAVASILTVGLAVSIISITNLFTGAAANTIKGSVLISGLKVVGSIAGGGIAAGIAITAVPVIFSIAGLGLYRLYKA